MRQNLDGEDFLNDGIEFQKSDRPSGAETRHL